MSDLLPCPFCGGKKLLATTNEHGGFCLTCENCDAIGPPSEYDPAQMREAWNTRAALEPVTVRTCATCGHPENNHPYRHPFFALVERGE